MGFSITSGPPGIFGAVFIAFLAAAAVIVATIFFRVVRDARNEVVEDSDDDPEV